MVVCFGRCVWDQGQEEVPEPPAVGPAGRPGPEQRGDRQRCDVQCHDVVADPGAAARGTAQTDVLARPRLPIEMGEEINLHQSASDLVVEEHQREKGAEAAAAGREHQGLSQP